MFKGGQHTVKVCVETTVVLTTRGQYKLVCPGVMYILNDFVEEGILWKYVP